MLLNETERREIANDCVQIVDSGKQEERLSFFYVNISCKKVEKLFDLSFNDLNSGYNNRKSLI